MRNRSREIELQDELIETRTRAELYRQQLVDAGIEPCVEMPERATRHGLYTPQQPFTPEQRDERLAEFLT